ncbi:Retrovirus-related Pol polyprotein from transposon TNT 1-94 [Dendrobium catenatum]|uniref:Retrovirus-related Pol polyprotein from transposon TNT 1-94 n=1 Tax=Dendrobium catenatum TaxID=906689 RepID=A0A2I0X3S9_9ASPA|nr:Retrovirus-related Pol polyprotein from transposon TNT 1-94 [Dendrobium catenatum]
MNTLLSLIHSDVWGPAPVDSVQGYRYYVIFIDDFSRFTWLFPLRQKSEVFETFVSFKNQVEKYTAHTIKTIRTDGGTEFLNNNFNQFLVAQGIRHQVSCPYTPEQNGVAERKHRHVIETARTLLKTASVPFKHWPEAVITSVYLINRLPSTLTSPLTPFELLHRTKPEYTHLRIFGCACYPLLPPHSHHKFQSNTKPCVMLGYSDTYKGYKCLDMLTNKTLFSRHVTFHETSFPFSLKQDKKQEAVADLPPLLLVPTSTTASNRTTTLSNNISTSSLNSNLLSPPTLSASNNHTNDHSASPIQHQISHPMVTRTRTGKLKPVTRMNLFHAQEASPHGTSPANYTEAFQHQHWRTAMANEFLALQQQGTWSLVPPPPNTSILGCRWTYRTKFNSDGSIAKYKARLVAQGHRQEFGLDYNETFSPVVKLPTIRIMLAIALSNNWQVHQLDVANAFLHGKLSEQVFMIQPKGFEDTNHPKHVCQLHKAIYGLKQAPRQWYTTFMEYLISIGFESSSADPSLFILRKHPDNIYLLVYVDDILITGSNQDLVASVMHKLSQQFSMKNLGSVHDFLGIKIDRYTDSYFLSQTLYANSILQQAGLLNCNPTSNPTCTKIPDNPKPDAQLADPGVYRRITGSLQYLTLTRPDIAYSVNKLSQHMHNPEAQHIFLLKKLLRYIKGTIQFGIPITKSELVLKSFTDADWAGDPSSRKSTSGFCSFLGKTLISWTVKKQHTVARSSTESEYRALAALTADIIWLRRLLSDFGIHQTSPTEMFCDNMSAIALANNPVFHARTKHIEIDQKFIRDHIQQNHIRLLPISTVDQPADIFTKPLSTPRFEMLRSKLTVSKDPSVCGGILEYKTS